MRSAFEPCNAQKISFIPLPIETFGGWRPEAEKQIARIGRELARSTAGADQKTSTNHLFQRLSSTLQKGNAALILSRSTDILYPCRVHPGRKVPRRRRLTHRHPPSPRCTPANRRFKRNAIIPQVRSLIDEIRGIFIAADLGVDSQITHLLAAGTHPRLKRSDNLLNSVAPKPASEDKPNVSYSSWLLLGWEGPSLPLSHFVSRIFRGNRLGMINF